MNEWLDLMLDEIARKQRELKEAQDELARRKDANQGSAAAKPAQSK
jgi:hypothetical protein